MDRSSWNLHQLQRISNKSLENLLNGFLSSQIDCSAHWLIDVVFNRKLYKRYGFLRCEEERNLFLTYLLTLNAADYHSFTHTYPQAGNIHDQSLPIWNIEDLKHLEIKFSKDIASFDF